METNAGGEPDAQFAVEQRVHGISRHQRRAAPSRRWAEAWSPAAATDARKASAMTNLVQL